MKLTDVRPYCQCAADFREAGYTPDAICNFLSLLGWNPGMKLPDGKDLEKFDTKFLCEHFGIERIGRTNAKFDRAKLLSFNADALGAMSDEAFIARWLEHLGESDPDVRARVAALPRDKQLLLAKSVKPRAKTFRDATRPIGFLFLEDGAVPLDPAAVEKNLRAAVPPAQGGAAATTGLSLLRELGPSLRALPAWEPAPIEDAVNALADARGVKLGAVAQAVRTVLTGTGVSPALGDTMALLGRQSTLGRIDAALARVTP